MKKVIADASILIHLSAIGKFHLLQEPFQEITIPEGVYTEVAIAGKGLPGSQETLEAVKNKFLKVNNVMDKEKVREISEIYKVSASNAEVIQLAKETNTELVLADEQEVRDGAESAGFKAMGCLGILVNAVKGRFISSQQAVESIDNLVKSGYRISDDILRAVKESLHRLEV
jgi:predicted nucleic acid-binding protein